MTYVSTKTYGHEIGLSCAFRQWKADSHCHLIHGYAIAVRLEFEAQELDHTNWVVDFGGLKEIKKRLEEIFDHKLLVAADDPHIDWYREAEKRGIAKVILLDNVGCEAFSRVVWELVTTWMIRQGYDDRVICRSVEVREHGANSAIYEVPRAGIDVRTADLRVARALTQDSPS